MAVQGADIAFEGGGGLVFPGRTCANRRCQMPGALPQQRNIQQAATFRMSLGHLCQGTPAGLGKLGHFRRAGQGV